jgi:hypothetical protein
MGMRDRFQHGDIPHNPGIGFHIRLPAEVDTMLKADP